MKSQLTRRNFISTTTAVTASAFMGTPPIALAASQAKPNILWITSEDNGPHLGVYGHEYADTPNLDKLASRGVIFTNAWSNAPVCAPARTTIISGVYPPSTGSEHMRSHTQLPNFMHMFPWYLRQEGYYCTNNVKEDYNLEKRGDEWDESSQRAHWRNRKDGQPFFSVFNFTTTHESQIRQRPHKQVHDPAEVPLPSYHPDTPEVRQDWAQYHDKMTEMDAQVGQLLADLEADGLAEDTIIFYYGDHGPGMPRGKRWLYQSGLHVPLIVHVPEKYKHLAPEGYAPGAKIDRLVGFIDLAPTVLSLVGIQPPAYMQGDAFMGEFNTPAPDYMYAFRGRMDERLDLLRAVRNDRFLYIRNFMPHKAYGQYLNYMFQTPTTQVWKRLYDEGKLEPQQRVFWERKPFEELYDLEQDPEQIRNLAESAEHREVLNEMRGVLTEWQFAIRDVGLLPEDEMHKRAEGSTPYEVGHDEARFPMKQIWETAQMAASMRERATSRLAESLSDDESAVRYWAVLGMIMRGDEAVRSHKNKIKELLKDSSPSVCIAAAQALTQHGNEEDFNKALPVLLELADQQKHGLYAAIYALNAIDELDEKAKSAEETIKNLPIKNLSVHQRLREYVNRLVESTLSGLE